MRSEPQSRPLLRASSEARLLVWIGALLVTIALTGVYLITTSNKTRGSRVSVHVEPLTDLALPSAGFDQLLLHPSDEAPSLSRRQLSGSGSTSGHEDPYVPEGLLAAFCTLALGAFILQIISGLPLPYTVLLLIMGMLLGALVLATESTWYKTIDEFQQAINIMGNLDAHLLLHIFLPPLIFESAFAVEWHIFDQLKWYCLLLAVPGLLVATYATGALANLLLMPGEAGDDRWFKDAAVYGDNFGTCASDAWSHMSGWRRTYLLGVILSATDPVAVVALLKELGVKAELSIGIEGESLLNDGTALVIFAVLTSCVQEAQSMCSLSNATKVTNGDGFDEHHCLSSVPVYVWEDHWFEAGAVIWKFIFMAVIGGLFGLAMAFTLVAWISKVFNDAMVEITLTLTFAYLTFFLAELFKMSGVLAVVALGLYMGKNGRTRISPEVEHFLHEFWELLAYFGNTLIFVIAGIMIVADFGKDCDDKCREQLGTDAWQLLVLYLGCTLIRFTLVTIAYTVMNTTGLLKMPWKDSLVATWGGLRGAVGLACAIIIFKDEARICENIRRKIFFHTSGICVLTVLVNGVTMRYLIQALGMDKMAPAKAQMFSQALRQIGRAGQKREQGAMKEAVFETVAWDVARKYYVKEEDLREDLHAPKSSDGETLGVGEKSMLRRKVAGMVQMDAVERAVSSKAVSAKGEMRSASRSKIRDSSGKESTDSADSVVKGAEGAGIVEVRRRILMRCKQSYWNQLEAGLIQRDAAKYLRRLSDVAVTDNCNLCEWAVLKNSLSEREKWEHEAMVSDTVARSWRVKLNAFLNSVGWTFFVMVIVIISIVFGLSPALNTLSFIDVVDYIVMIFFILEVLARMISSSSVHAFVTDPYCIIDLLVVLLDLATTLSTSVTDSGNLETLPRLVRVLRTLRLLKGLRLLSASKRGAANINGSISDALDRCITYSTTRFSWLSWLLALQQRLTVGHFEMEHNVVSGFLAAREEAVEMIPQFLGEIPGLEADTEFQALVHQLHTDVERAHAALLGLRELNPEAYASITTVIAARSVLHAQQKAIRKLSHEGMLDHHELEHIDSEIERQMKRLVFSPPYIPLPGSIEVLRQVHWTHVLSEGQMELLLNCCEEKSFAKGQMLLQLGEFSDNVYVVKKGTLRKERSDDEDPLSQPVVHMGQSFNEVSWQLNQPSQFRVMALQDIDMLIIPGGALRNLAESFPLLNESLWLSVGSRITQEVIVGHALEAHSAALAPWQLARIMRTVRMHHVRRAEMGKPIEGVEKYTFLPHATLVLVSGGASVLAKTRLERAADGEQMEVRQELATSAAAPAAADDGARKKSAFSRSRTWSIVRMAAEHRKDEMVRFTAPCIIMPPQPGAMFRVAFDAETRFAVDEDGIFVPPQPSALLRLTSLAHQVLKHTREISAARERQLQRQNSDSNRPKGRFSQVFGLGAFANARGSTSTGTSGQGEVSL